MQAIRKLCERLKAFFTKKPSFISEIVDDSKIIDENTDDLEFHVPAVPEVMTPDSSDAELPMRDSNLSSITSFCRISKEEQTPSVPTQLPTALEFLSQQRLVCTATDTDTQHLDVGKPEDKQDVKLPSVPQNDLD
jgi:hypothetical protein